MIRSILAALAVAVSGPAVCRMKKKSPTAFVFAVLVWAVCAHAAAAAESAYDAIWTKQIGTAGDDKVYSAVTNSAGQVFVFGTSGVPISGCLSDTNPHNFLMQYGADGSALWQGELEIGGEFSHAVAMAMDQAGNIFLVGRVRGSSDREGMRQVGFDLFLNKYAPDGTVRWKRQLGTPMNDMATSLVVDRDGHCYVAGKTAGSFTDYGYANAGGDDLFVVKYDDLGNVEWLKQTGTPGDDEAAALATDYAGTTVTIAGSTQGALGGANAGLSDIFVMQYSAQGNRLWTLQFGTESDDRAYGLTTFDTGAGGCYLTGTTRGALDGGNAGLSDLVLAKISSAGRLEWARQSGTSGDERSYSVAVDGEGSAYVAGRTTGSFPGYTNAGLFDLFVAKYDGTGALLWTKQMGTAEDDEADAVAVAAATGDVYVAGYTRGSLANPGAGGSDAFLAKLAPPLDHNPGYACRRQCQHPLFTDAHCLRRNSSLPVVDRGRRIAGRPHPGQCYGKDHRHTH